jgi:hypothetical protein
MWNNYLWISLLHYRMSLNCWKWPEVCDMQRQLKTHGTARHQFLLVMCPWDNTEYKRLLELWEYVKIHHPIWIYWSESNSLKLFYKYNLNKNWNIYWSKQSFTVLELEDQCSSWRLMMINLFPDFSEVLLYIFVKSTTTRSS